MSHGLILPDPPKADDPPPVQHLTLYVTGLGGIDLDVFGALDFAAVLAGLKQHGYIGGWNEKGKVNAVFFQAAIQGITERIPPNAVVPVRNKIIHPSVGNG